MIETIRLATARATVQTSSSTCAGGRARSRSQRAAGVVGGHLLEGRPADRAGGSAEKALRSQPDEVADWVVLMEAVEAEAIRARCGRARARPQRWRPAAWRRIAGVGCFHLQFGLTHAA